MKETINDHMKRRLCDPIKIVGTIQEIITKLLEEHIISPKEERRKMPYTEVIAKTHHNLVITFELKEITNLFEVIEELCIEHNLIIENDNNIIIIRD